MRTSSLFINFTREVETKCCRIHTIRFPDPCANAYTAQGRAGRLPRPTSLPSHTGDLGPEGLYPWARFAVASVPCARCCGVSRRGPTYSGSGNCTTEARAKQSKRWLGLRTVAECRASRSPVSELHFWRFRGSGLSEGDTHSLPIGIPSGRISARSS